MRYTIRFYDQKKPKQWEFSLSGFPEGDSLYDIIRAVCNEQIAYVSYETDTEYKYKQPIYATTIGCLYGLKDCIGLDFQLEPTNEFLNIRLDINSNGLHIGHARFKNRSTEEKEYVKFIELYTRVEREDTMSVEGRKPEKSIQMI